MKLLIEIRRLIEQLRTHGLYLTTLAATDKFGRKLLGHPIWRFSWITPNILLGGQPARRLQSVLHTYGVTGVINMRQEYDYGSEIGQFGWQFKYLYLPTVDQTAPSIEHLKQGVEFIDQIIKDDGKVYIHCWEGLGRGPTMVAAYLVSGGLTPDEAWTFIRNVRPFINPSRTQQERLQAFAEVLVNNPLEQNEVAQK